MLEPSVRGFNPRAFLIDQKRASGGGCSRRALTVSAGAILVFAAFGSIVVRANEDTSVYAFIQQQVRPTRALPAVAYAPQQFFPRAQGRSLAVEQPRGQRNAAPRQPAILTSYAPFGNIFIPDGGQDFRRAAVNPQAEAARKPARKSARRSVDEAFGGPVSRGGRVAYCVRTCDGYYFPAPVGGSDRQIEAACNRVCPTAEVKVYFGEIGGEMDTARAAAAGSKRYASLASAFSYRRSIDAGCACNPQGYGMTTNMPVERDTTLRVGDIVMTGQGLKVFNGGAMPYHQGNFTRVQRSARYEGRLRSQLIAMDQASTRGLASAAIAARPAPSRQAAQTRPKQEAAERTSAMTPRRSGQENGVARVVLASPLTEVR
jgi:hypothetical protein